MRGLILGVVLVLSQGVAAHAATADPQVTVPIQKFIDGFNKGDLVAAAATHSATPDLAILDEVPPYLWQGPQAFKAWSTDLDSDAKKRGITDQAVTIMAPTRVEANGEQAYVVVPAVYAFKERGVAMRESAQMTFVLKKGAGGWLIHGWTWTGPTPKAATPAKP